MHLVYITKNFSKELTAILTSLLFFYRSFVSKQAEIHEKSFSPYTISSANNYLQWLFKRCRS